MKTPIIRFGLLLAFIVGLFLSGNAQSTEVQLIITTIDGVEQTYTLSDENRISFGNGTTLDIEIGDIIIEYALADIRKITCHELEGTDEDQVSEGSIFPNPVHDMMILRNLDRKQMVSIFAIDGRLVKSFEAVENQLIDISDLPSGLYLVKTYSSTLKMIKL